MIRFTGTRFTVVWTILILHVGLGIALAEDPIFSGPQVDEKLPSFKAIAATGSAQGDEFDFVGDADGKPVVVVFVHKLTRPGFGMLTTILPYIESQSKTGLSACVCFLLEDPNTKLPVLKYFTGSSAIGISPDGLEGPGAYGLNRNVTLTVLVGKDGKVTDNFALVQPSLPTDGAKILKAIGKVIDREPPSVSELESKRRSMNARRSGMQRTRKAPEKPSESDTSQRTTDKRLMSLVRAAFQNDLDEKERGEAVAAVETYIEDHDAARIELVQRSIAMIKSKRMADRKWIEKTLNRWVEQYGEGPAEKTEQAPQKEQPDQ